MQYHLSLYLILWILRSFEKLVYTIFFFQAINVSIFSYYPNSHERCKIERYCTNEHYTGDISLGLGLGASWVTNLWIHVKQVSSIILHICLSNVWKLWCFLDPPYPSHYLVMDCQALVKQVPSTCQASQDDGISRVLTWRDKSDITQLILPVMLLYDQY